MVLLYAFLIIYVVPLLTVGVYKIIKKHKEQNGKQYQYQVKREDNNESRTICYGV